MRMQVVTYFILLITALLFYNNESGNNVLKNKKKQILVENLRNFSFICKVSTVKPKKTILFPLQKPFSVMKSGDSIAKFVFYIDRKKTFRKNGICFNRVYLLFPLKHLDKDFLIGFKGEAIYTAFDVKDIWGFNYFFSFKERNKRKIGYIIPDPNTYLLLLDNIYKEKKEYIYKINYEFADYSLKGENTNKKNDYNYLPEWEIKEMYYTKNRGLIKAIIKNNKNNLIYTALPD